MDGGSEALVKEGRLLAARGRMAGGRMPPLLGVEFRREILDACRMEQGDCQFFNPWGDVEVTKNHLPHWQQPGAVYFVTWRMADSIPQDMLNAHFADKKAWSLNHPEPWDEETETDYHRLFSSRMDEWMDAGHGSCVLKERENAEVVSHALHHFEGERTAMVSCIVMPNHVHALFAPHPERDLGKVVQSWKSYTAKEINRRMGSEGEFWQKDYFDRLIRDGRHFGNCVRYIRRNGEKANLSLDSYLLWESELAKRIE